MLSEFEYLYCDPGREIERGVRDVAQELDRGRRRIERGEQRLPERLGFGEVGDPARVPQQLPERDAVPSDRELRQHLADRAVKREQAVGDQGERGGAAERLRDAGDAQVVADSDRLLVLQLPHPGGVQLDVVAALDDDGDPGRASLRLDEVHQRPVELPVGLGGLASGGAGGRRQDADRDRGGGKCGDPAPVRDCSPPAGRAQFAVASLRP